MSTELLVIYHIERKFLNIFLFYSFLKRKANVSSPLSSKPDDIKREHNIICQVEVINNFILLEYTSVDRGLINPFTKKLLPHNNLMFFSTFMTSANRNFSITYHSTYSNNQVHQHQSESSACKRFLLRKLTNSAFHNSRKTET